MTERKKLWISIIAALFLRFALLPFFNFGDVNNSVIWGIWAKQFGTSGYYDFLNFFNYARPNQPPLTILLYDGLKYLYDFTFFILWQINIRIPAFPSQFISVFDKFGYIWFLKLPAIFSDLGLGLVIYKLTKMLKSENSLFLMNLYLFNPISWYNSVVWGQTDSVLMLLGFGSVLLIFFDFPILALILFALTLLFKATLITFLPIIVLMFWLKKISFKQILLSILAFLVAVWVVSKPFAVGPVYPWLFNLYTTKIVTGELPLLTANTFNFWNIFFGQSMLKDSIVVLGLKASTIGFILFIVFSIKPIYDLYRKFTLKQVLFALVFITFSAFLFLTRMHERYLYPIFVPLLILTAVQRKLVGVYVVLSVLMLLNMYNGWWVPKITILMNFVANGLVEKSISLVFIGIFFWLMFNSSRLLSRK